MGRGTRIRATSRHAGAARLSSEEREGTLCPHPGRAPRTRWRVRHRRARRRGAARGGRTTVRRGARPAGRGGGAGRGARHCVMGALAHSPVAVASHCRPVLCQPGGGSVPHHSTRPGRRSLPRRNPAAVRSRQPVVPTPRGRCLRAAHPRHTTRRGNTCFSRVCSGWTIDRVPVQQRRQDPSDARVRR
jgi:hypothetical protein